MYLAQNIACPLVYLKGEICSTYSLIEYFRAIFYGVALVLQVIFRRLPQKEKNWEELKRKRKLQKW